MQRTCKAAIVVASALAMLMGTSSFVAAEVVTFGSDHDGLGGFTTNTVDNSTTFWTLGANSVQYRNQNTGTYNSSLLREFVLDRSDGRSYVISGKVTMTDGYADDNNRLGMYLFGDSAVVPSQLEAGAIGIIFNTDDGSIKHLTSGYTGDNSQDNLNLRVGIDSTGLATVRRNQVPTPYAQDLFGTTMTFETTIAFVGANIEIMAKMIDKDGAVTTTNATVAAANYTGDYFGFVNRSRSRNYTESGGTPEGQSLPWVMDYREFSITGNEPAPTLISVR